MSNGKTYKLNAQGVKNLEEFREACKLHDSVIPIVSIPEDDDDSPELTFKMATAENISDAALIAHGLRYACMMIDPKRRNDEARRAKIYARFCQELAEAWRDPK